MAEFEDARAGLRQATASREAARDALIAAEERAKRLARQRQRLIRRANTGEALAELDQDRRALAREIETLRARNSTLDTALRGAVDRFAAFTDPAKGLARLSDDTPIALFPLRLETRFRTIAGRHRLWVRAFPDDVLVDTFQPEISAAEYSNTAIYWTSLWRGGQTEPMHRAAWSALAKAHGTGRAAWLTQRIAPLNPGDAPAAMPGEHVLVIRPATPVPAGEQGAIAAYWARIWSSGGTEREAAMAELAAALGAPRAAEVEAALAPANLLDPAVKPDGSLVPNVVFLDLPAHTDLSASEADWTRGARAWMLPERLTLVAFQHGKQAMSVIGKPIPAWLQVGPDPSAGADEQIRADGAELDVPDALRWTVDFQAAVDSGMGFDIDLDERGLAPPFERLFVLGVRIGASAEEGAEELATLVRHHQSSRRGLDLLPQGSPTNNTEEDAAAHSWWVDPADSFAHHFGTRPAEQTHWRDRPDGAWLSGLLGLDPSVLRASTGYFGTDQTEARAMNEALWPATLGYYMDQMMEPVFSDATRHATRDFFTRFVLGRGTAPLIRIGRQPYGILPTTAWSRLAFWQDDDYREAAAGLSLPDADYLEETAALVARVAQAFRGAAANAPHVGAPGDDAQQTLLSILGLHPSSARFFYRYSQSFTQYINAFGFSTEPVSDTFYGAMRLYVQAGLEALSDLGWTATPESGVPDMLQRVFNGQPFAIPGPLGSIPLSEAIPLPIDRADGLNFIAWLKVAAETSHDTLRKQEGFDGGPPIVLLYQMLRHALDLGYIDTGFSLRAEALRLTELAARAERREPKFLHISEQADSQSRWAHLYRADRAVTGDDTLELGEFIPKILKTRKPYLATQIAALDRLKNVPTVRLERTFVEHIDCLSYRLDAWRSGVHAVQLAAMRQETEQGFGHSGLFTGAYGWLEDIRPKDEMLTPVALDDELTAFFEGEDQQPLMASDANLGHIHAPSLDHAVTAAILRNGYEAHREKDGNPLAIDLSSERVRLAERTLEGIRNGQPLGALLGYQLERALHDEPNLFLDRLIHELRREFPLAGNRNRTTRVVAITSITQVEARNVVDGAAFAKHIAETGIETYPYGLTGLPPLSEFSGPGLPSPQDIGALIDVHVALMRSTGDAVADLSLAEGVYQMVRGNPDRAAGMLDAVSKGTTPHAAEISATPRSGQTLTHRIALHLEGGLAPAGVASGRPRARGEPALAAWVATLMPDLATVFAKVSWTDSDGATDNVLTPNLAALGLDAIDLFYLLGSGEAQDMAGFDEILIDFAAHSTPRPRDDAIFSLEYMPTETGGLSLFELAPLVRALRGTALGARPLRASDLSLESEAAAGEDSVVVVRADKAETVRDDLEAEQSAVQAFVSALTTAVGDGAADEDAARDAARDGIDTWLTDYAALARAVQPFGLTSANPTTALEGRRPRFAMLLALLDGLLARWQAKETAYAEALAALGGAASDEDRQAILIRAGRLVSSTIIAPLPPTLAGLQAEVDGRKTTFDGHLADLQALRNGAARIGETLVGLEAALPAIRQVDLSPPDLGSVRDSVLALARDLLERASALDADITQRLASCDAALARATAATGPKAETAVSEAAQAIVGEAFMVLPEFTLSAERLAEWDAAWTNRADLFTHLTAPADASPLPVEDWLHGIAHVRERPRHLELTGQLGQCLGAAAEPLPEPVQFPHRPGEGWLALEFPATNADGSPFVLEENKLLYAPIVGPGGGINPADPARRYAGLMLDEWIEVIPTETETTGLAFHFDRPNAEAPQAILLATPPRHRGAWLWDDLVETLHDTLDFAQIRALEPADLNKGPLATLLPAVLSTVTALPITATLSFAMTANLAQALEVQTDD
ncbi:MAG: hypothetical protein QNJ44_08855 [Rhodobacter sp.]|nr:hypothetical protein [Rhodobacter sp.]